MSDEVSREEASDESKYEAFGAFIVFLIFVVVVVTMDQWVPVVKDMVMPGKIVVVECTQ